MAQPRCLLSAPLLALGLAIGAASAAPAQAPASRVAPTVTLSSGAVIVARASEEPLSAGVAVSVGSAADPSGQEGLAELTARSLTAASEAHRASGDLVYRLASSVGGAGLEVGDASTTFLLSDVTDLPTALRLMTDAVARPAFPISDVLAARRSLQAEALEDLEGGPSGRRIEALHALLGTPSAWDRAWAIGGLDPDDVRAFHSSHFGPSRLRVAIAGTKAPALEPAEGGTPLEDLPGDLAAGVGAWTTPLADGAASLPSPVAEPQARLLTGAAETGVTLAMPARDGSAFLALLAAADASQKATWTVRGPGRTSVGALSPPPGAILLAECKTSSPSTAAKDLLAQLARLAKRAPSDAAWSALTAASRHAVAPGDRAAACLDQLDAGRGAGLDCDPASALASLSPEAVRAAAAALASGPRALVAAVASGDDAASKAWLAAFPESTSRAASEPESATGRERLSEARAWIAAAVAAHGGPALTSVSGWTRLSDESVVMDELPKAMGSLRIDTSAEPLVTRHEYRPLAKQLGVRLVVLSDWAIERRDGGPALDPIESVAIRTQLLRQPLALLKAAASGRYPVRSEGVDVVQGRRVRLVSLATADQGLTRLAFDDKSGQLVSARFRQRARATLPPREVTLTWSDLREVDGVLVPFTETLRAGESSMSQVSAATSWKLRREPFDPARVSTSPDDLAAERTAS